MLNHAPAPEGLHDIHEALGIATRELEAAITLEAGRRFLATEVSMRVTEKFPFASKIRHVVLTALEPNDDGTNLKYGTKRTIAREIYRKKLETLSGSVRSARLNSYVGSLKTSLDDFARNTLTPGSERNALRAQARNKETLAEARRRWPEVYESSSDEELLQILVGELPFLNRKPELFADINDAIGQLFVNVRQGEADEPAPQPSAAVGSKPDIMIPSVTVWQRPATATSTVGSEPKRSLTPAPARPESKKPKTKLEIFEANHGNRRMRIFLSLVERNDSEDDFRFKENDDVIENVYKDELAKYKREDTKGQCLKNLRLGFIWSREYCVQMLAEYARNPDEPKKETIEAWLEEATKQLGLETPITPGRLIYVLRRHIDFTDVSSSDSKFDEIEWNEAHDMIITHRRTIETHFANDRSIHAIHFGGDNTIAAAYRDSLRANLD
jgi:hypothetical protein